MTAATEELITDEIDLLRRLVPLGDARVIELGCGKAELARRLVEHGWVSSVTALEVDAVQHERNVAEVHPAQLHFVAAGAAEIPFPDASFDVAMMLKSLHHVPIEHMDRALAEVQRVLVPGGYLYVSEPVYAGAFNDIVRLFHDEGTVRAAAHQALRRAAGNGILDHVDEIVFQMPLAFRDFDDFCDRLVRVTYQDRTLQGSVLAEVRRRFEQFMTPQGARFVRPMRVNLMRRPTQHARIST